MTEEESAAFKLAWDSGVEPCVRGEIIFSNFESAAEWPSSGGCIEFSTAEDAQKAKRLFEELVLAERERCAAIAVAARQTDEPILGGQYEEGVDFCSQWIEERIRGGTTPKPIVFLSASSSR